MAAVTSKCPQCAALLRLREKRLIGREIRCPRCRSKFVAIPPETLIDRETPDGPPDSSADSVDSVMPTIRVEPCHRPGRLVRRGRRRRTPLGLLLLFIFVIAGGVGGWWAASTRPSATRRTTSPKPVLLTPQNVVDDSAGINASGEDFRPAPRTAISMDYVPVVPHLVLHLRPAEIWLDKMDRRELTGTLGDLGMWLHESIQQTTGYAPSEIEELTMAVNFGSRTSVPDMAAVARLTAPIRESQLMLQRMRGKLIQGSREEVYEFGELAYVVIDSRTLAVSSRDLAQDLIDAKKYAAVPQPEMEAMLKSSDRSRHMTLIVDLHVMDQHKDLLLMEQLHRLAEDAVLWLGTDCRVMSWSAHLDPHLSMETRLLPAAESTARELQTRIQRRLEQLPERFLAAVRTMNPATVGQRRIIGRFPAMMQALTTGTQVRRTKTEVVLTTILPQKAAANLAAGATLSWNESVRQTDSQDLPDPAIREMSHLSVAQRLFRRVLIDFRREPLQEALQYIGSEIEVSVSIDGDALKRAGLTQNLSQTHDLGQVSALKAIDTILRQYDGKMVIVVDESRGTILVTTQEAAGARRQSAFDTSVADQGVQPE